MPKFVVHMVAFIVVHASYAASKFAGTSLGFVGHAGSLQIHRKREAMPKFGQILSNGMNLRCGSEFPRTRIARQLAIANIKACRDHDEAKRESLNRWLSEAGVLKSGVEIANCGKYGEGLVAKRAISPNQEILFELPLSLQIREDTALKDVGEIGSYLQVSERSPKDCVHIHSSFAH
jgi:hypothetical protein